MHMAFKDKRQHAQEQYDAECIDLDVLHRSQVHGTAPRYGLYETW